MKKIFLLFVLVTVLAYLFNSFCFAQGRELEVEYPELGVPGVETPTKTKTALSEYLRYVFTFAIIVAGLLAFGALIYGGIRYLTSAGDPTKMKDAMAQATAGILGLIILLSSYLILNTINPQLVLPKKPPLQPAVAGIYAYVRVNCLDEPDDAYDDRVLIDENIRDLSELLPKDENGVPQSLQCIEFRSGEEELTVKVYSNVNYLPEPPTPYEGDLGETKNVTGKSIKLDYHPPGVYLYAEEGCEGDYKIYQSGSATLPEFDGRTQSIKFRYGFRIITIPKDKSAEERERIWERECTNQGEEINRDPLGERGDNRLYQCITQKYAVILHEKENFMGEVKLFDQEQNVCKKTSENLDGSPNDISVSSITIYLKPPLKNGQPQIVGPGVRFYEDKNYTGCVLPETGFYPTKEPKVANLHQYGKKCGGYDEKKEECKKSADCGDRISSMDMDGHYVALLFKNPGYKGNCEVFMSSDPNFRNNRIGQCGWLGRSDCLSSFIIKARK